MSQLFTSGRHLHLGITPLQLELKHRYIWVQPWIWNLTTLDLNLTSGETVFTRLGGWLGINEASVLGLLSTLANTIPTFALVKDMDRKGKVLNFAFMTSASFAFADHLAFCTAVAPKLLLPMLVTKLTAAVAAFLLAWCFVQKTESLNP